MRAKKCDRCGKLYEHYDGSKEFKNAERANAVLLIDSDLDNKYWSRKSFDLCPNCMRTLEVFIKNEEDYIVVTESLEDIYERIQSAEKRYRK
jgi:protein-arginine kinase activator protein McsA